MYLTLLITGLAVWLTYVFVNLRWKTRNVIESYRKRDIPYSPVTGFLSTFLFKKRMELDRDEIIRRVGKVFGTDLFGQPNLTLADPELIQQVLSKDFTTFPNRREFNSNDPIFENFLSVVELDQWKRIRTIVAPTFATGKMRKMKPCLDGICKTLITNIDTALKNGETAVNMKQYAGAFTMDTVVQVAFGVKVDSLADPSNQLICNAKKLFSADMTWKNILAFFIVFALPKWVQKIVPNLALFNAEVLGFLRDFSLKIIEQKRKEFSEKDFTKASNFIEFLLEAEHELKNQELKLKNEDANNNVNGGGADDENKKPVKYLTNDELIAQCVLFFLAGYDTTATLITTASYYLALNPEIQERAYESIQKVLNEELEDSESGNILEKIPFEWYNSSKFEYISSVINETLRMMPPAPFLERRCMKDTTLETSDGKKIKIEKNEMIQIPVWTLHHCEEYFPEPEQFRPERFCKETADPYPKYAFIPFGSGPRACVAKSLALMEGHMALIWLIYNYRFIRCERTPVPMQFYNNGGLLVPKDIYLKIEQRN